MKNLRAMTYWFVAAFAATAFGGVSELDIDGYVHFHTADDAGEWYVVEGSGASGGAALCPKYDDGWQDLYVDIYAYGTLNFKFREIKYCGIYSGALFESPDTYDNNWHDGSVCVKPGDDQWFVSATRSTEDSKFYLSDMQFTPAPSSMTVAFDLNGGDGTTPAARVYAPGNQYCYDEALPVPERSGFEFVGWQMDSADGEFVEDYDDVEYRDHTLVACWCVPVSNLDGDGFAFECDDIPRWEYDEDGGIGGCPAVVSGKMENGDSSEVVIRASGYGKLSFDIMRDGPAHVTCEAGDDYDNREYVNLNDHSFNAWAHYTIPFDTDCEHFVEITAWYWNDTNLNVRICNVEWTPAPDEITVAFDSNGGSQQFDDVVKYPGDCYDSLPTPTRNGYTFLGWCIDSIWGNLVGEDSKVELEESVTLVAKWCKPMSAFSATGYSSFKVTGDDKWYVVDCDGEKVIEAPANGKMVTHNDWSYWGCSESTGQATITKAGYYSFDWMVNSPKEKGFNISSTQVKFTVDGETLMNRWVYSEDDWKTCCFYVGSGTHTVKWEVEGMRDRNETEDEETGETVYTYPKNAPTLRLANFCYDSAGAQPNLQEWLRKARKYNSWNTGNLSRFRDVYAQRIAADSGDYEARLLHAACTLGILAENAEFKTYIKSFGGTVDFIRMNITGTPKFNSKCPASNKIVDRMLAIGGSAIKSALADLEAIPQDSAEQTLASLSAEEWPIDEDLNVDAADVRYMMSGLQAALAGLNYAAGYDLTVDWSKINSVGSDKLSVPSIVRIPAVDDESGWSGTLSVKPDSDQFLRAVRMCRSGSTLGMLCEFSGELDSTEPVELRIYFELNGESYYLYADSYGDGYMYDYDDEYSVSTTSVTSGNKVRVTAKLSAISGSASGTIVPDKVKYVACGVDDGEGSVHFDNAANHKRAKKVLDTQTAFFGKVRNQNRLDTARSLVGESIALALEADALMSTRTDDGMMHFVEYDPEDEENIAKARDNASLALSSLETPTEFDLWSLMEDPSFDLSLVPNDGILNVYLGALFDGCFNRQLAPKFSLGEYGRVKPDFGTMPDPTLAGLFPDMTYDAINRIAEGAEYYDFAFSDPIGAEFHPVPGTQASFDFSEFRGYTAKGLPSGWKWNSATGELSGTATSNFTVTFTRSGRSVSRAITLAPKPVLSVDRQCSGSSSVEVTGGGRYAANTKVKLLAAVSAESSFLGWFDGDDQLLSRAASYSMTMPATNATVTAKTIPIREDYLSGWLTTDSCDVELGVGVQVDDNVGAYFAFESESPYSVSASGLPTGVSLVNDGQGYHLSGIPRKRGVFCTTFVAKNNGGYTCSIVIRFLVGGAMSPETDAAGLGFEDDTFTLGENVDLETGIPNSEKGAAVKSVAVKGQPTGISASYRDGKLTLKGIATKVGKFDTTITVTYADKSKATTVKTFFVQDSGSKYIGVYVGEDVAGGSSRGTASGGGMKTYGSKLTFKAKSADAKKYFFAGWYLDSECTLPASELLDDAWQNASVTHTFALADSLFDLYALFITKGEDAVSISCDSSWQVESYEGGYEALDISVSSRTAAKLSASSLPAGVKLSGSRLVVSAPKSLKPGNYNVTLTAKSASGAVGTRQVAVVVPNITDAADRGYINGLDTSDDGYSQDTECSWMQAGVAQSFTLADLGISVEEGWTLSVSGLPAGWSYSKGVISGMATKAGKSTVTFTVTNKAKKSYRATATFDLADLPVWARGTFVGAVLDWKEDAEVKEGTITFTVSAGKISGNYNLYGTKYAFTAGTMKFDDDGNLLASPKVKIGSSTKTFAMTIKPSDDNPVFGSATFGGEVSAREYVESVAIDQNPWTHPDRSELDLPVIESGKQCSFEWYGNRWDYDWGTVTLKFGGNGQATVVYESTNGSVSGSAQLVAIREEDDYQVARMVIGIPYNTKKRLPGTNCIVELVLTKDEYGAVDEIHTDDGGSGSNGVWSYEEFGLDD